MKRILLILTLAAAPSLFAQHHPKTEASPFSQSLEQAYLTLQSSLANDDLNGAHESALLYISAFQKSTARLNVENLTRYADEIAQASSLSQARLSFKGLSEQAKMLFDYLATDAASPLYLAHCSMAFDGQGADWIQKTETITNPYYGASMPHCGNILRAIGSSKSAPATTDSCCSNGAETSQTCDHTPSDSCCNK